MTNCLLPGSTSVSLTQVGGSGTLVGFEPSNIAGATFRTRFGRFGRTIGTSRATEVYSDPCRPARQGLNHGI